MDVNTATRFQRLAVPEPELVIKLGWGIPRQDLKPIPDVFTDVARKDTLKLITVLFSKGLTACGLHFRLGTAISFQSD